MAAGTCLLALALSERYIVGPMRKQQQEEGTAPSVSIFGDIAAEAGGPIKKRTLPGGSVLNEDGSIAKTTPKQ